MTIKTELELLQDRRTKIVATLGPASADDETVTELIKAGVSVFRLNMSHGTHAEHQQQYDRVRRISHTLDLPIAVFADLCGPKIRTGLFNNHQIELTVDSQVVVTRRMSWVMRGSYPRNTRR